MTRTVECERFLLVTSALWYRNFAVWYRGIRGTVTWKRYNQTPFKALKSAEITILILCLASLIEFIAMVHFILIVIIGSGRRRMRNIPSSPAEKNGQASKLLAKEVSRFHLKHTLKCFGVNWRLSITITPMDLTAQVRTFRQRALELIRWIKRGAGLTCEHVSQVLSV